MNLLDRKGSVQLDVILVQRGRHEHLRNEILRCIHSPTCRFDSTIDIDCIRFDHSLREEIILSTTSAFCAMTQSEVFSHVSVASVIDPTKRQLRLSVYTLLILLDYALVSPYSQRMFELIFSNPNILQCAFSH